MVVSAMTLTSVWGAGVVLEIVPILPSVGCWGGIYCGGSPRCTLGCGVSARGRTGAIVAWGQLGAGEVVIVGRDGLGTPTIQRGIWYVKRSRGMLCG